MIFVGPVVKKVLLDILMKYLKAKENDLKKVFKKKYTCPIKFNFYTIPSHEKYWLTVEILMLVDKVEMPCQLGKVLINENGLSVYGYTTKLQSTLEKIFIK